MILAAALLAGSIATFVAPAQSASALAIDCSYDSGLSVFIGSGRDGLTCMGGGTRTPGTVYGSGSLPGQSAPGGASLGSVCTSSAPPLPDVFYGWGNISISNTGYDTTRDDGSVWHSTVTMYSRNGRYVAARYINTSPGKPFEMNFNDFTLIESGVLLTSSFNCRTDSTWVVDEPTIIHGHEDLAPVPGAPTPVSHSLETTATMAPVPFQPGKYFLRLDMTNNHPSPSVTGYSFSVDLGSYVLNDIVTSPRDASCPEGLTYAELCVSPAIRPGETQTYTMVVSLRTGRPSGDAIRISTFHDGWRKVGILNRPGTTMTATFVAPTA